jgi:hypothetical protein
MAIHVSQTLAGNFTQLDDVPLPQRAVSGRPAHDKLKLILQLEVNRLLCLVILKTL